MVMLVGLKMRRVSLLAVVVFLWIARGTCLARVQDDGSLVRPAQVARSTYLQSAMKRFCQDARCLDQARAGTARPRPTLTAFTGEWRYHVAALKDVWLVEVFTTLVGSVAKPETMFFKVLDFQKHVSRTDNPTCDVSEPVCVSNCMDEEPPSIWTWYYTYESECRIACRVLAEACSYGKEKQAEENARWHAANCNPGHYCPLGNGIATSTMCPKGTFRSTWGGSSPDDCQPCPAAYTCEAGTSEPVPCPQGSFCQGGGKDMRICPAGFYCRAGSTVPEMCPSNTFCPTGSHVPQTCPAGSVCEYGASRPMPCPPGGYCKKGAPFTSCPTGSYSAAVGQESSDTCTLCPAGYVCGHEGSTTFSKSSCPPGTFGPRSGAKTFADCVLCPAGAFCGKGVSQGKVCPRGTYCPDGAPEPTLCPPNTFCRAGSHVPETCPAGSVCKGGSSEPTLCPKGAYCAKGAPLTLCPSGTFSDAVGQSSLDTCTPCPAGYVCEFKGSTTFRTSPCPAGTFGKKSGATSFAQCRMCPSGRSCAEGVSQPKVCPPSTYCPAGAVEPITCPAHTFCPAGSQVPQICPAGSVCKVGSSEPLPCGRGGYCPEGKPFRPCPRGTHGPAMGQGFRDACVPCPSGHFCGKGSSPPRTCPARTYCRVGAKKPTPCSQWAYCPPGARNPWQETLLALAPVVIIFSFLWWALFKLLRPRHGILAANHGFRHRLTFARLVAFERKRALGVLSRWLRTTPRWRVILRRRARHKFAMTRLQRWYRRNVRRKHAARLIQRRVRESPRLWASIRLAKFKRRLAARRIRRCWRAHVTNKRAADVIRRCCVGHLRKKRDETGRVLQRAILNMRGVFGSRSSRASLPEWGRLQHEETKTRAASTLRRCFKRHLSRKRASRIIRRCCMSYLLRRQRGRLQQLILDIREALGSTSSLAGSAGGMAIPSPPLLDFGRPATRSRPSSTGSSRGSMSPTRVGANAVAG